MDLLGSREHILKTPQSFLRQLYYALPGIPKIMNAPPRLRGGRVGCGPGDFLKIRIRAIDGGERTGDMKHKGDNATEGKRKRVRERDKG